MIIIASCRTLKANIRSGYSSLALLKTSLHENTPRLSQATVRRRNWGPNWGIVPHEDYPDTQSLRLKITWARHAFIYVASIPNRYTWHGYVTITSSTYSRVPSTSDTAFFSHKCNLWNGRHKRESAARYQILRAIILEIISQTYFLLPRIQFSHKETIYACHLKFHGVIAERCEG